MPCSVLPQNSCHSTFNREFIQRLIHWNLSSDYNILDKDSMGFKPIPYLVLFSAHSGS